MVAVDQDAVVEEVSPRVSKGLRNFFYSWGNFANTVAQQVFNNRLQFFYLDVLRLSPNFYGPVWALFGLWNAINDPLMGNLSDRTRSRWGRRIPYILFGAIPLGLAFWLMWTPPRQGSQLALGIYFLIAVFIFDTLLTLLTMANNSLFPEIAPTTKERSSVASTREILAVIALLMAFILAPILSEDLGFGMMGLIFGGLVAVGYGISVIGVKEKPIPEDQEEFTIVESLRITLSYVPFRWYIIANLMKEYVFIILAATLPFWVKYGLGITEASEVFGVTMSPGDQEAIMLGGSFILAIPFLMLWRWVTPRIGVRRAWQAASIIFIPGLLIMAFAETFYAGLAGTLSIAPGLAGYMMLPIMALSEVIDLDAEKVGRRREGVFFGINGALIKIAFTVQALFYWVVLSTTGYSPETDAQSAAAVAGIRFLMGFSPAIAVAIAAVALQFFKPDEPEESGPSFIVSPWFTTAAGAGLLVFMIYIATSNADWAGSGILTGFVIAAAALIGGLYGVINRNRNQD